MDTTNLRYIRVSLEKIREDIPDIYHNQYSDFIELYIFALASYIRNVYRWNSKFSSKNFKRSKFNYEHANKNGNMHILSDMQSNVNKYRKIHSNNNWNNTVMNDFVRFCMFATDTLLNKICESILIKPQYIISIYARRRPINKKSSRINYDVVEAFTQDN